MPEFKETDISSQVWQTRILLENEHMNSLEDSKLRKRAAKRSVPDAEKDSAYWERRHRNNAAAKRSREIKRQQESSYKSFVANAIASFEQLSKWCRTLLEYCPQELRKQAEAEVSAVVSRFHQTVPQNAHSDRPIDMNRSLSPHGDDYHRGCDGDLDTDGGSHSSMISETGDDSGDLQITHIENCSNRESHPPLLSPAPVVQMDKQIMNKSPVFTNHAGDAGQLQTSAPTIMKFPTSVSGSVTNVTAPIPSSITQNSQFEAMQYVLQKQQVGVGNMGGIPVIISPDSAVLNTGYQQLLLKSLASNPQNLDQKDVNSFNRESKLSMLLPDQKVSNEKVVSNSILKLESTSPVEPIEAKTNNVLAVDPATGNVVTIDPRSSNIFSNEKRAGMVSGVDWQHQQAAVQQPLVTKKRPVQTNEYLHAVSATSDSPIANQKAMPNATKWSPLSLPLTSEDIPKDIKDLIPPVSRVFVSLDTNDIVELIRCIAQEFIANMGDSVPSAACIWQIFIAIRDAISILGKFRPEDITQVIRNQFVELRQRSLNETEVMEDNQLPYQQLLTHFQAYLTEQLKEQRSERQGNRSPSPKRPRLPEKKNQNAFQDLVNSIESADGGVIDNALHRCSVELEKRSQMTFKRLEMLRSRPGITIEQLNDELKKITNNSDSFQKMLDKAMTNEMHLRSLHAKARNYHSNGTKKQ